MVEVLTDMNKDLVNKREAGQARMLAGMDTSREAGKAHQQWRTAYFQTCSRAGICGMAKVNVALGGEAGVVSMRIESPVVDRLDTPLGKGCKGPCEKWDQRPHGEQQ